MKLLGSLLITTKEGGTQWWRLVNIRNVKIERLLLWRGPRGREQESYKAWPAPSTTKISTVAMLQTQVLIEMISWNVRGLGSREKKAAVKDVIRKFRAELVLIQESKLTVVTGSLVKEVWGGSTADWVCRQSVGASGVILVIWNRKIFAKIDQWVGNFSVSVVLEEVSHKVKWTVTTVYGPNDSRIRHLLWEELDSIRRRWNGPWYLGGDWNVIRFLQSDQAVILILWKCQNFLIGSTNILWLIFNWGERSLRGRTTKRFPLYLA